MAKLIDVKKYVQDAIYYKYGFDVPLNQINVIERKDDYKNKEPQWVVFSCGGHEYRYDGITLERMVF